MYKKLILFFLLLNTFIVLPVDATYGGGIVNAYNAHKNWFLTGAEELPPAQRIKVPINICPAINAGEKNLAKGRLRKIVSLGDHTYTVTGKIDFNDSGIFYVPRPIFSDHSTIAANWDTVPSEWYYLRTSLFDKEKPSFTHISPERLPPIELVKAVKIRSVVPATEQKPFKMQWHEYPGTKFYQINFCMTLKKNKATQEKPGGLEAFWQGDVHIVKEHYTSDTKFSVDSSELKHAVEEMLQSFAGRGLRQQYKERLSIKKHNAKIRKKEQDANIEQNYHVGIQIIARNDEQGIISKSPFFFAGKYNPHNE